MSDHICDACSKAWPSAKLKDITDLLQRISPGGTVPSGECPSCGALCFPSHVFKKQAENFPPPRTIEDYILLMASRVEGLTKKLDEVALELRKKNKNEEARLTYNQNQERLKAIQLLKKEGLMALLPEMKEKFEEDQKKKALEKAEQETVKEEPDAGGTKPE